MIKRKLYNKICPICGMPYLTNRSNSATCSEPYCQEENNRQKARDRFKRKYHEEKDLDKSFLEEIEKSKPKRNFVTPAHEIEAEARKHGMNYGQYYALMLQKQEIEERERRKANV